MIIINKKLNRLVVASMLLWVACSVLEVNAQGYWQSSITTTGQLVGSAVRNSIVVIGVQADSSTLDVPPPPPEYSAFSRLWGVGWAGPYSRDIRQESGATAYYWIVGVDPHGNVPPPATRCATMSWNPSEFLTASKYRMLRDTTYDGHGDFVVVSDMLTTVDYEVCGLQAPQYFVVRQFEFECGDFDGSNRVDLTDVVYFINYMLAAGPAPLDFSVGDVNCSGRVDMSDAVYMVNYIFVPGWPPPCFACP